MKKLNAEEILEIVGNNYSESSFAHNEWTECVALFSTPDFSEFTKKRDEFYDLHKEEWASMSYKDKSNSESYKEWAAMPSEYDKKEEFILNELGLGKVVEVDQYGGEGQGDRWWSVKHFVDHNVYIKITGHYSSYNGTDFYAGYGKEVKPAEKVVTVFE